MDIHRVYSWVLATAGFRRRRMEAFAKLFSPDDGTRIVDIGGSSANWSYLPSRPTVVMVNIDRRHGRAGYPKHLSYWCADALHLPCRQHSFDIAFSNSVIEHVSTWSNQQEFAREVSRVARRIWVQTPAREFFMEPHLLTPFIHWLPRPWQRRLIRRFTVWGVLAKPSPVQVESFLAEVRLLTLREMRVLFPDCRVHTEYWMGLPKSYVAYRV